MMLHRFLVSAALAGIFSVSPTDARAGGRDGAPGRAQAVQALEKAIHDCGPQVRTGIVFHRDRLSVIYSNPSRSCAFVQLTVGVRQSACEGIDTFAFAFGGSDLASGSFRNIRGFRIADLFGDYRGHAFGAGLLAGGGRWSARRDNGISFGDKRIALPIPIPGGDLGLGYTSCDFSVNIRPLGPVKLVDRSLDLDRSLPLDMSDVMGLPLF